jgi:putative hemolysin
VEVYRNVLFIMFMLLGIVVFPSCNSKQISPTPEANMPNPASVHCEQNGGKLELRQDASGGVVGVCVFHDGSECDEWAYFRGECKPGDSLVAPEPTASPVATEPTLTATAEFASDGWKIYRDEKLGYSFHYPADANIITNDDPLKGLSIIGPLTGNDNWPIFYFSHPSDREDYRPPEGADLVQWLTDHYLLADERQPDVQIAGTTAIHTRHARSPQSFADDRYYFAKSDQLYVIVILHAGDKEDWELYNRFLESIQFEQ